jgi:hypothetical protein
MKFLKWLFGKTNKVTADNLHLQKMSTLFDKVIDDIKAARNLGLGINMHVFGDCSGGQVCAVCLGGAAALGLMDPKQLPALAVLAGAEEYPDIHIAAEEWAKFINNGNERKVEPMMRMFDCFRIGDYDEMFDYYNEFSEDTIEEDEAQDVVDTFLGHYEHEDLETPTFFGSSLSDDEVKRLIEALKMFSKCLKINHL